MVVLVLDSRHRREGRWRISSARAPSAGQVQSVKFAWGLNLRIRNWYVALSDHSIMITVRNCGKVWFLHLSVILSTGERGCLADPPRQTPPPPRDSHCSGRYGGTHPTEMHSCCNCNCLFRNEKWSISTMCLHVTSRVRRVTNLKTNVVHTSY